MLADLQRQTPFRLPEAPLASACNSPFFKLRRFNTGPPDDPKPPILIVPPLSGHFAALLRDMVVELDGDHDVHVIDWVSPRYVPLTAGAFTIETSVECVLQALDACPSPPALMGLCQSVVPVLLAACRRARRRRDEQPAAVILMAGPIDAHQNQAGTAALLRAVPIWMYRAMIGCVPHGFPGVGRRVFPSVMRTVSLVQYAMRHTLPFDPLLRKFMFDDGADPILAPFGRAYFSTMDLHADWLLETLQKVYFKPSADGLWAGHGDDLSELSSLVLMTIEGALDDVAAPGQTHAAQRLCPALVEGRRFQETIPGAGHFDLFHGRCWREEVAPLVRKVVRSACR